MGIHRKYTAGRIVHFLTGDAGGIDFGTEAAEATSATADKKFVSIYAKSTATSGDERAIYARLKLAGTTGGAGYGDAVRALGYVTGTGYAYACGTHSTLRIGTGATVTGSGAGLRATLEADAQTRTLSGALAALQVDSYVGANNTMPTVHGFIRFSDVGSVVLSNLFVLPSAPATGTVFATHTTQTMTHSIRIIGPTGTAYYLMCCDAATNRT
jgi:hypothetical protein